MDNPPSNVTLPNVLKSQKKEVKEELTQEEKVLLARQEALYKQAESERTKAGVVRKAIGDALLPDELDALNKMRAELGVPILEEKQSLFAKIKAKAAEVSEDLSDFLSIKNTAVQLIGTDPKELVTEFRSNFGNLDTHMDDATNNVISRVSDKIEALDRRPKLEASEAFTWMQKWVETLIFYLYEELKKEPTKYIAVSSDYTKFFVSFAIIKTLIYVLLNPQKDSKSLSEFRSIFVLYGTLGSWFTAMVNTILIDPRYQCRNYPHKHIRNVYQKEHLEEVSEICVESLEELFNQVSPRQMYESMTGYKDNSEDSFTMMNVFSFAEIRSLLSSDQKFSEDELNLLNYESERGRSRSRSNTPSKSVRTRKNRSESLETSPATPSSMDFASVDSKESSDDTETGEEEEITVSRKIGPTRLDELTRVYKDYPYVLKCNHFDWDALELASATEKMFSFIISVGGKFKINFGGYVLNKVNLCQIIASTQDGEQCFQVVHAYPDFDKMSGIIGPKKALQIRQAMLEMTEGAKGLLNSLFGFETIFKTLLNGIHNSPEWKDIWIGRIGMLKSVEDVEMNTEQRLNALVLTLDKQNPLMASDDFKGKFELSESEWRRLGIVIIMFIISAILIGGKVFKRVRRGTMHFGAQTLMDLINALIIPMGVISPDVGLVTKLAKHASRLTTLNDDGDHLEASVDNHPVLEKEDEEVLEDISKDFSSFDLGEQLNYPITFIELGCCDGGIWTTMSEDPQKVPEYQLRVMVLIIQYVSKYPIKRELLQRLDRVFLGWIREQKRFKREFLFKAGVHLLCKLRTTTSLSLIALFKKHGFQAIPLIFQIYPIPAVCIVGSAALALSAVVGAIVAMAQNSHNNRDGETEANLNRPVSKRNYKKAEFYISDPQATFMMISGEQGPLTPAMYAYRPALDKNKQVKGFYLDREYDWIVNYRDKNTGEPREKFLAFGRVERLLDDINGGKPMKQHDIVQIENLLHQVSVVPSEQKDKDEFSVDLKLRTYQLGKDKYHLEAASYAPNSNCGDCVRCGLPIIVNFMGDGCCECPKKSVQIEMVQKKPKVQDPSGAPKKEGGYTSTIFPKKDTVAASVLAYGPKSAYSRANPQTEEKKLVVNHYASVVGANKINQPNQLSAAKRLEMAKLKMMKETQVNFESNDSEVCAVKPDYDVPEKVVQDQGSIITYVPLHNDTRELKKDDLFIRIGRDREVAVVNEAGQIFPVLKRSDGQLESALELGTCIASGVLGIVLMGATFVGFVISSMLTIGSAMAIAELLDGEVGTYEEFVKENGGKSKYITRSEWDKMNLSEKSQMFLDNKKEGFCVISDHVTGDMDKMLQEDLRQSKISNLEEKEFAANKGNFKIDTRGNIFADKTIEITNFTPKKFPDAHKPEPYTFVQYESTAIKPVKSEGVKVLKEFNFSINSDNKSSVESTDDCMPQYGYIVNGEFVPGVSKEVRAALDTGNVRLRRDLIAKPQERKLYGMVNGKLIQCGVTHDYFAPIPSDGDLQPEKVSGVEMASEEPHFAIPSIPYVDIEQKDHRVISHAVITDKGLLANAHAIPKSGPVFLDVEGAKLRIPAIEEFEVIKYPYGDLVMIRVAIPNHSVNRITQSRFAKMDHIKGDMAVMMYGVERIGSNVRIISHPGTIREVDGKFVVENANYGDTTHATYWSVKGHCGFLIFDENGKILGMHYWGEKNSMNGFVSFFVPRFQEWYGSLNCLAAARLFDPI